jgi:RimJ/RimL family protein N-acetyltransferase
MWCGEYGTVTGHVPKKWRNNGNHHHSPASPHPFEPTDWAFFRSLREDRRIMRYMAAIAPEKETRRVFAARCCGACFVIRADDDTPLGDIGLQISAENREEADIGYTVVPAAQGKGSPARRCARCVITPLTRPA